MLCVALALRCDRGISTKHRWAVKGYQAQLFVDLPLAERCHLYIEA
ncbi:hypothetical protein AB3R30_04825 [Leptolyngbyaceae cyanobacterium UHCC 1019]